jgi:hypothetical protein
MNRQKEKEVEEEQHAALEARRSEIEVVRETCLAACRQAQRTAPDTSPTLSIKLPDGTRCKVSLPSTLTLEVRALLGTSSTA